MLGTYLLVIELNQVNFHLCALFFKGILSYSGMILTFTVLEARRLEVFVEVRLECE